MRESPPLLRPSRSVLRHRRFVFLRFVIEVIDSIQPEVAILVFTLLEVATLTTLLEVATFLILFLYHLVYTV